jgi:hypothetical protein
MQGKRGINQYRRTGNRKLGAGASKTKNGGEFLKKNHKKKRVYRRNGNRKIQALEFSYDEP